MAALVFFYLPLWLITGANDFTFHHQSQSDKQGAAPAPRLCGQI
jgi:hypothetical protein